jgi:hypothetical protein
MFEYREAKTGFMYDEEGVLRFKITKIVPEGEVYELSLRSAAGNYVPFTLSLDELADLQDLIGRVCTNA